MRIETPPQLPAAPELYSYLYRLSEMLNLALEQVDRQVPQQVPAKPPEMAAADSARELKALIVSTAQVVRKEMEEIRTDLHGAYQAVSAQFGSFQETLDSRITANAEGILQQYGYAARLDALESKDAGFDAYMTRTQGFIKQGFVDYDGNGVPIVGIAIGQNLRSVTVNVGGQRLEQLDGAQSCAFYTADRVSFRIGGGEVAYISNRKLYILDAEVTGTLTVGGWLLSHDSGGLTLRCIGG